MKAQPNREEDKKLLLKLSVYLNTSVDRLKVDSCGDWNILGRKGNISTDSELWYLYTEGSSKRHWTSIKKQLSFMIVSQDGDEEGILKLERMPSPREAEVIRKVCGLRARPELTEEERAERSRRSIETINKGVSDEIIDLN